MSAHCQALLSAASPLTHTVLRKFLLTSSLSLGSKKEQLLLSSNLQESSFIFFKELINIWKCLVRELVLYHLYPLGLGRQQTQVLRDMCWVPGIQLTWEGVCVALGCVPWITANTSNILVSRQINEKQYKNHNNDKNTYPDEFSEIALFMVDY